MSWFVVIVVSGRPAFIACTWQISATFKFILPIYAYCFFDSVSAKFGLSQNQLSA